MRKSFHAVILIVGAVLWSCTAWCDDEAETPPVPPDTGSSQTPPRADITAKATELGLTEGRVDTMRAGGMGWGEIGIAEDLAAKLVETSHTDPPLTGDQAMDQILKLRSDGMGWGQIAHEYNLKLGEVKSASHRPDAEDTDHELKGKDTEHPEHSERPEKTEKMGRPDSTGKPDKAGKHDDNGHPDNPGKDHSGKPDNTGKPEHAGNMH